MSMDSVGRVIVGSGHFIEKVPHIIEGAARIVPVVDRSVRNVADRVNVFVQVVKSDKQERAKQQALDNLKQLGEAGRDLAEAFGWGAAGDVGQAQEKASDAFGKMASVFGRGFRGPGN